MHSLSNTSAPPPYQATAASSAGWPLVPNNSAAAVGSANSEKSLTNSEKSRPLLNTSDAAVGSANSEKPLANSEKQEALYSVSDAAVGSANSEKSLANSEKQEAVYSVRCTLLLGTLG